MPRLDIGDYELEYDPAENELTITQPNTGDVIVVDGSDMIVAGLSADMLTMDPKQSEPAPVDNLIYLDDGTNTADGQPGFRFYDGTNWVDL